MLTQFIEWAHRIKSGNVPRNFTSTVAVSDLSENCSARFDIDTPVALGRVTFWETGAYHAQTIDLVTEKTIYEHRGRAQNGDTIPLCFTEFLKSLEVKSD